MNSAEIGDIYTNGTKIIRIEEILTKKDAKKFIIDVTPSFSRLLSVSFNGNWYKYIRQEDGGLGIITEEHLLEDYTKLENDPLYQTAFQSIENSGKLIVDEITEKIGTYHINCDPPATLTIRGTEAISIIRMFGLIDSAYELNKLNLEVFNNTFTCHLDNLRKDLVDLINIKYSFKFDGLVFNNQLANQLDNNAIIIRSGKSYGLCRKCGSSIIKKHWWSLKRACIKNCKDF
jgi:hypothetical protein